MPTSGGGGHGGFGGGGSVHSSGGSGGYQTGADFDGNPKTDFSDGDNW